MSETEFTIRMLLIIFTSVAVSFTAHDLYKQKLMKRAKSTLMKQSIQS